MRHEGIDVKAIIFYVPIEEILHRAEQVDRLGERKGSFNEQAVATLGRMVEMIEDPSLAEGFSEIEVRRWEPETREATEGARR